MNVTQLPVGDHAHISQRRQKGAVLPRSSLPRETAGNLGQPSLAAPSWLFYTPRLCLLTINHGMEQNLFFVPSFLW